MNTVLLIFAMLAAPPLAHDDTERQAQGPAQEKTRSYEFSDLGWLEGCWEGTGFGSRVAECWMSAPDGRLTGMFQMIDADGNQTMSEIFVLDEFDDGPAIRLKHFHADLTGWEGQDEFMVFPLRETGPDFARFDGLTYRLESDGRLVVELMVSRGSEASLECLEFRRVRD